MPSASFRRSHHGRKLALVQLPGTSNRLVADAHCDDDNDNVDDDDDPANVCLQSLLLVFQVLSHRSPALKQASAYV